MVVFGYCVIAYVAFVLTSLYAVGFVGNWSVSLTVDRVSETSGGWFTAMLVNAILVGLFALQHTLMGRPAFRSAMARIAPAAVERSTHVLISSLFLMQVFARWRPIPYRLYSFELSSLGFALELLSLSGWALAFFATFQFSHLDLFGLAQGLAHVRGEAPTGAQFEVPFLYRWVRHPIYFGILVAVWCAPVMTVGHLLLAAMITAWVRVLARLEETDLALEHPEYGRYRAHVPMLFPRSRALRVRRRAG